jgi:hypothetical protein
MHRTVLSRAETARSRRESGLWIAGLDLLGDDVSEDLAESQPDAWSGLHA